jgi:hypothetical protein
VRRLAACALLFAIVLGSAPGQGKSRRARPLSKRACERICVRIMECAAMPRQNSTVVEALICTDDCVFESKDARVAVRVSRRHLRGAGGVQARRQGRRRRSAGTEARNLTASRLSITASSPRPRCLRRAALRSPSGAGIRPRAVPGA